MQWAGAPQQVASLVHSRQDLPRAKLRTGSCNRLPSWPASEMSARQVCPRSQRYLPSSPRQLPPAACRRRFECGRSLTTALCSPNSATSLMLIQLQGLAPTPQLPRGLKLAMHTRALRRGAALRVTATRAAAAPCLAPCLPQSAAGTPRGCEPAAAGCPPPAPRPHRWLQDKAGSRGGQGAREPAALWRAPRKPGESTLEPVDPPQHPPSPACHPRAPTTRSLPACPPAGQDPTSLTPTATTDLAWANQNLTAPPLVPSHVSPPPLLSHTEPPQAQAPTRGHQIIHKRLAHAGQRRQRLAVGVDGAAQQLGHQRLRRWRAGQ